MRVDNSAYGIRANGVDDDGPGIRAALADAALADGVAELCPGRYLVGRDGARTHCVDLVASLIGSGVGSTVLIFPESAPNAKGVAIYDSGRQLAALTLDGSWSGDTSGKPNRHNVFVGDYAEGTRLRDLESINADGDGIYIHDSKETLVEGLGPRLVCRGNRRNSLTFGSSCDGAIVRHVEFDDCGAQHVDSEPKVDGRTVDHVRIIDALFGASGGSSIATPGPSMYEFNRDWLIERCRFTASAGELQIRWVDGAVVERCYWDAAPMRYDVHVRRASRAVRVSNCTFNVAEVGVVVQGNQKTGNDIAESVTLSGNTYNVVPGARGAIECGVTRSLTLLGERVDAVADPRLVRGISVYPSGDIDEFVAHGCIVRAEVALQLGWPGFSGIVKYSDVTGNVLRGVVAVRPENFGAGVVQPRTEDAST